MNKRTRPRISRDTMPELGAVSDDVCHVDLRVRENAISIRWQSLIGFTQDRKSRCS